MPLNIGNACKKNADEGERVPAWQWPKAYIQIEMDKRMASPEEESLEMAKPEPRHVNFL